MVSLKLKLTGVAVALGLVAGGIWLLAKPADGRKTSVATAGLIDCTRGVACPIIWHPPKERSSRTP